MSELQVRPIIQWPGKMTKNRRRSQFRAGYGSTMDLIEAELSHLRATAVCLLMALEHDQIRLDGRPRASAIPQHPGVILTFNTPSGPRQFPCDRYDDWGDNLRAIGLSLQALRAVDRYGVTQSGEQYTGFAALPPPNSDHWTRESAVRFLECFMGRACPQPGTFEFENYIRAAERKSHPDTGGDPADFKKTQQARDILLGNVA